MTSEESSPSLSHPPSEEWVSTVWGDEWTIRVPYNPPPFPNQRGRLRCVYHCIRRSVHGPRLRQVVLYHTLPSSLPPSSIPALRVALSHYLLEGKLMMCGRGKPHHLGCQLLCVVRPDLYSWDVLRRSMETATKIAKAKREFGVDSNLGMPAARLPPPSISVHALTPPLDPHLHLLAPPTTT